MKHLMEMITRLHKKPSSAVEFIFATLGNGIDLDNKGFIPENYRSDEVFEFPDPEPLSWIYPWSSTERFQPFRELAGCRDVGFKEMAQYFIDCVKITPDTVENIHPWKENIHVVEDVLLNTPTITDRYTINDMDKFLDDIKDDDITLNAPMDGTALPHNDSVKKVWFFDAQWSDCPKGVEQEVKQLWGDFELGNDHYMYKCKVDEELFDEYPKIYFWLKHKGVPDNDEVIIHWWW